MSAKVKVLIVGDGAIGKVLSQNDVEDTNLSLVLTRGPDVQTCLLSRITNNVVNFDDHQECKCPPLLAGSFVRSFQVPADEPTTFNNFNLTWDSTDDEGNPRVIDLEIWDTAGNSPIPLLLLFTYMILALYPSCARGIVCWAPNGSLQVKRALNSCAPCLIRIQIYFLSATHAQVQFL